LRRKVAESDVLQMAYLSVHQSLGRFTDRGSGSFKAWLERIVDHRITDVLRQYVHTARRGLAHEVSGPQPLSGSKQPARQPTPSVIAVGEELRRTIEAAMARLPDDYRRVLHLVQGEGLTLAEAGVRMGRSAGAAKQLYSRALGRLRRLVRKSAGRNHG
jgi:RNA polymerase sigma-70 factor (ECF subfamily)